MIVLSLNFLTISELSAESDLVKKRPNHGDEIFQGMSPQHQHLEAVGQRGPRMHLKMAAELGNV